jgi:Tfp pilus assembly protein PilX
MPNDLAQLLIGLTVLILLALGFGMSSARLFMWATRGSGDGSDR